MTKREYRALIKKKDREIARLKREVDKLSDKDGESGVIPAARRVLMAKGYFGYLVLSVKNALSHGALSRARSAIKKYSALSRAVKAVSSVVSFVRASAAAIVILGVAAVLLPAALIYGATLLAARLLSFGRPGKTAETIRSKAYVFAFAERRPIVLRTAYELSSFGQVIFLTPLLQRRVSNLPGGAICVDVSCFFRLKRILERNGVKIYYIS